MLKFKQIKKSQCQHKSPNLNEQEQKVYKFESQKSNLLTKKFETNQYQVMNEGDAQIQNYQIVTQKSLATEIPLETPALTSNRISLQTENNFNSNQDIIIKDINEIKLIKGQNTEINKNIPRNLNQNSDSISVQQANQEIDQNIIKFYNRRYELFSLYDQGIKLDYESWYSVTPEWIAQDIAQKLKSKYQTVLDGFCGVGGNSIQFAAEGLQVIVNDIDPIKIEYLINNCQIYQVNNNIIQTINQDFFELNNIKCDVVFLAPPWGGINYISGKSQYSLRENIEPNIVEIIKKSFSLANNLVILLPKNINFNELTDIFDEVLDNQSELALSSCWTVEIYYYQVNGKVTMTLVNFSGEKYTQNQDNKPIRYIQSILDEPLNMQREYNINQVTRQIIAKIGIKIFVQETYKVTECIQEQPNQKLFEILLQNLIQQNYFTQEEINEIKHNTKKARRKKQT